MEGVVGGERKGGKEGVGVEEERGKNLRRDERETEERGGRGGRFGIVRE